jgi:hypothetical protein
MLDEQISPTKLFMQQIQQSQRAVLERIGKLQLSAEDTRDLLVSLQGLLDLLERPEDQEETIGAQMVTALGQIVSGMQRLERQQAFVNEKLDAQNNILSQLTRTIETQNTLLGPIAQALELEDLPLAQG